MALTDKLKAIADAIRGKTGQTNEMTLDEMVTAIKGISADGSVGGDTGGEPKMARLTLKRVMSSNSSSANYSPTCTFYYWGGTAIVSGNFVSTAGATIDVPVGTAICVGIYGNATKNIYSPQMSSKNGVETKQVISASYTLSSKYHRYYAYIVVVTEEEANLTFNL